MAQTQHQAAQRPEADAEQVSGILDFDIIVTNIVEDWPHQASLSRYLYLLLYLNNVLNGLVSKLARKLSFSCVPISYLYDLIFILKSVGWKLVLCLCNPC